MTNTRLLKWVPDPNLPERPATLIDLNWQAGNQRLIATVTYATNRHEEEASAVVIFEDVFAFAGFEENMDIIRNDTDWVPLAAPYPYGGSWPYIEMLGSSWLAELVQQHGAWTVEDLRHFVITSRNMHLHIASMQTCDPTCVLGIG